MSHLPLPILAFFLLTTLLALLLVSKAVRGLKTAVVGSLLWMCAQSAIALSFRSSCSCIHRSSRASLPSGCI